MAPQDRTAFREQLSLPWWSWPVSLAVAAGLAFEIGLGVPGAVTWLPFALLVPGTAVLLWRLGGIRTAVGADAFRVDDASLPLEYIDKVEPLAGNALRDALASQLHPLAFVIQRPWVKGAVRVKLNDPQDPTPYWIISTRNPARLCEALDTARAGGKLSV